MCIFTLLNRNGEGSTKVINPGLLSIAFISFNAAFAQQDNDRGRNRDRYEPGNVVNTNDRSGKAFDKHQPYGVDGHRQHAEMNQGNPKYDQRTNRYGNDRSGNTYERERRNQRESRESPQNVNAFGNGMAVGAIAGVLLGVLISR